MKLREEATIGDVVDHLRQTRRPRLPDSMERLERALMDFDVSAGEDMPSALKELEALRHVMYREITALTKYHAGHSPFETKHGVKGAEFENVLVVVGRGWNLYNFGEMLELARDRRDIPKAKLAGFERNRNLFYVACSRPKKRLAVLFTQKLSNVAVQTVENWFGLTSVTSLQL